jgi:hypothetical protein
MIIKQYGIRSFNYILRYPRHYAGYAAFSVGFYFLAQHYRESKNEIIRIGFAGSIAQFVTEIIFHPIDVINTRTKAEISHGNMNSYKMIRRIIDKEGMYGFWRGASATFYGALLGGLIYFSAYKWLKNYMKKYENPAHKSRIHTFAYLISSLLGESLFLVFYYPYDLIRTRMQTRTPGFEYKGPVDGCKRILNGRPIRNFAKLYVGATPSFILNLSNQSIMFTVLESMREYYLSKLKLHSVNELPLSIYLLCSVAAGVVSGAATNIMEVVTIHKQVDPTFKFTQFLKEQGVKALTQGLFARVTINVMHSVTLFFVVDEVSKMFDVEL